MSYLDPYTNERYIPHVIEPTFGLSRTFLMILISSYHEETVKDAEGEEDIRVVLKLPNHIAPYKVAVLPLVNKLNDEAMKVYEQINKHCMTDFDTSGTIGKRYRRQDEIGTPYCVTIDFDTIEKDQAVTVRDRDTTKQERVKIEELLSYLRGKLG